MCGIARAGVLSFRADAPGNLPEICGSCANYPMDPPALHIYQTASAAQHKDKTPKTPQKPYYSPSGRTSPGPLMAIYIIILTLENGVLRP